VRFLANENVTGSFVRALRGLGLDVTWVREDAPGMLDPDVLERAVSESRILVTFDKDFGELAYRSRLPASCGIVLFRLPPPSSPEAAARVAAVIAARDDWTGRFAVVEAGRVRMRDLPRD
jgi:predicted nuclease of predicted toxin-antitoxin system